MVFKHVYTPTGWATHFNRPQFIAPAKGGIEIESLCEWMLRISEWGNERSWILAAISRTLRLWKL